MADLIAERVAIFMTPDILCPELEPKLYVIDEDIIVAIASLEMIKYKVPVDLESTKTIAPHIPASTGALCAGWSRITWNRCRGEDRNSTVFKGLALLNSYQSIQYRR